MRMAAVLVLGAMLAGCGAESPAGNTTKAAAAPDPTEVKLMAASDSDRRVAFFRAIYDADYDCKKITAIDSRPRDSDNMPVWVVTCDDTKAYTIALARGGTFNVSGVPKPDGPVFPKATATRKPGPPPPMP